jgi:hypothetical protein
MLCVFVWVTEEIVSTFIIRHFLINKLYFSYVLQNFHKKYIFQMLLSSKTKVFSKMIFFKQVKKYSYLIYILVGMYMLQSLGLFLSFNMWKCGDVTRDVGDTWRYTCFFFTSSCNKYEEFLWGKAINQSVLMKWKYRGFLNKHVEFHNLNLRNVYAALGLFLSFNMWKCGDVTRDVGDTWRYTCSGLS